MKISIFNLHNQKNVCIIRVDGYETSPVPNRPRGRPSRLLIDGVESVADLAAGSAAENDNDSNVDSCDFNNSSSVSQSIFPDFCDEQALSMSVELAAVNQAIMSLTGQKPLNVKLPTTFSVPQSSAPSISNGIIKLESSVVKLESSEALATDADHEQHNGVS